MQRGPNDRRSVAIASVVGGLVQPMLAVAVSLVVSRRHGLDLWGSTVRLQVLVQVAALVAGFGAKDYLVTVMARRPSGAATAWRATAHQHLAVGLLVGLGLGGVGVVAIADGRAMAWLLVLWVVALVVRDLLDARVVAGRRFGPAAAAEIFTAALVLALVASVADPSRRDLVSILTLGAVVRSCAVGLAVGLAGGDAEVELARSVGLPVADAAASRRWSFGLIAVTGYVQSRGDALVAAAVLGEQALVVYLVLTNGVQLARATIALSIRPITPALHRLAAGSLRTLTLRAIARWSIPVAVGAIVAVELVERVWETETATWWAALLVAVVLPTAWRHPWTYWLLGRSFEGQIARIAAVVGLAVMVVAWPMLATFGVAGGLVVAMVAELTLVGWTMRARGVAT